MSSRCTNRSDPTALFPGKHGTRARRGFGKKISDRVSDILGRAFHPHLFRHFAVCQYLQENPGEHGDMQVLLHHKNRKTTEAHYSGAETALVAKNVSKVLEAIGEKALACGLGQAKLRRPRKKK
jgi:integrase